jgi:N-acetylglucosaminyldiphosphoundecaprenol N-acetyl-beta-D-mannosaminyltransferase
MTSSMTRKVMLFGLPFDSLTMAETLEAIEALIARKRPAVIFTPNVQRLVAAHRDPSIQDIYRRADLLLADGMPLYWASRLLKKGLKERVAGSDLIFTFSERASQKGYKVFLLGAAPGVAARAAERLTARYPGLKVAGTYSPPLGFERDDREIGKVEGLLKTTQPDLLFLALGLPKEERFLWKNRDRIPVPVSIGVGASIDFAAGEVRRAPRWVQRIGFEWLFRLFQDPGRLWKRYLVSNSYFFFLLVKEFISRPDQRP